MIQIRTSIVVPAGVLLSLTHNLREAVSFRSPPRTIRPTSVVEDNPRKKNRPRAMDHPLYPPRVTRDRRLPMKPPSVVREDLSSIHFIICSGKCTPVAFGGWPVPEVVLREDNGEMTGPSGQFLSVPLELHKHPPLGTRRPRPDPPRPRPDPPDYLDAPLTLWRGEPVFLKEGPPGDLQ